MLPLILLVILLSLYVGYSIGFKEGVKTQQGEHEQ